MSQDMLACSFTVCIGLSCFSLEDHCREELVCCFLFDIRFLGWLGFDEARSVED
ncbi:unnamed protein product [Amaranthus hypochondriacus]